MTLRLIELRASIPSGKDIESRLQSSPQRVQIYNLILTKSQTLLHGQFMKNEGPEQTNNSVEQLPFSASEL